jgi:hypothetical protein
MAMTLGDLLGKLRIRLNDVGDGTWGATHKRQYLNSGRKRTVVRAKCHRDSQSITVVAATHTYDAEPVFQPAAIRLGDQEVGRVDPDSFPIISENWDALPSGTPTKWTPISGPSFRVSPSPDSGAAGIISTVAAAPTAGGTGYAVNDVLEIDEGTGGKVKVTAVTSGVVTAIELNSAVDGGGKRNYDRGTGYTTGTGKATTKETGAGTGCTVNITALCKFELYGPSNVDDLTITTACTVAITGNIITSTAHGLAVGDAIAFSSTTGGFTVYQTYYVKTAPTADTFTVSATSGGTTFTITANGSNTWGRDEITEIAAGLAEEAILLAAEQEAMWARRTLTGAPERAVACHNLWSAECEEIRKSFEGVG